MNREKLGDHSNVYIMAFALNHDAECSFYDYTKTLLELVDGDELFHVNDDTYVFFHAPEIQTRKHLPQ